MSLRDTAFFQKYCLSLNILKQKKKNQTNSNRQKLHKYSTGFFPTKHLSA